MLAQISIHDDTGERTQGTERVDEIAVSPLVREFVRLRVMEFHADLKLDVGMLIGEQVISGLRPLLLFLDRRSGMRLRIAERRPDIEFDTAVRRYISEFVSLLKVPVVLFRVREYGTNRFGLANSSRQFKASAFRPRLAGIASGGLALRRR